MSSSRSLTSFPVVLSTRNVVITPISLLFPVPAAYNTVPEGSNSRACGMCDVSARGPGAGSPLGSSDIDAIELCPRFVQNAKSPLG